MRKVIVRTREDELTSLMYRFGHNCALQFIDAIESETHGSDWNSCGYSNDHYSCCVQINKNGTVSACVFNK